MALPHRALVGTFCLGLLFFRVGRREEKGNVERAVATCSFGGEGRIGSSGAVS